MKWCNPYRKRSLPIATGSRSSTPWRLDIFQIHHIGETGAHLSANISNNSLNLIVCLPRTEIENSGNPKGGPSYPRTKSTSFLRPVSPRHPWPQVGLLRSRPDLFPRLFSSRLLPASVHDTRVTWGRDIDVRL